MSARARSLFFSVLVFAAFFSSGAACLIAEVTWNRMLIVVVGNSMSAAAMIISIFMGGLGLGSYVGGRTFGSRRPSLVPYLVLELVVGVYVLLSPVLFDALTALFTGLAENAADQAALTFARLAVTTLALLLPAFLMGATFPAILSGATGDHAEKRSSRTAYLYATNTVGAAVGCFAAGYHLLFEFGVRFTLQIAFGLYLLAAASALIAQRLRAPETGSKPHPAAEATEAAATFLRRYLGVSTFVIGFVALGYEVLLARLAILYLGNAVSVFPLVLTAFLLGSGISAFAGTWIHGRLCRAGFDGDRLFGATSLLASALIIVVPYVLLSDRVLSSGYFERYNDAVIRNPLPILGILIVPTVLIGALLPVAIRMLQPKARGEGNRGAATLYALNTAGGILGAGLANHYLVPLIGIQFTLLALAGLCIAVGAVGVVRPGRFAARWAGAVGAVAIVVAALALALPDMMHLYAGKIAASTRAERAEVLLVHEGPAATVTVIDQFDPNRGTYRDMYLNGVEEASTRYWHTQLFKLLGILPVMLHGSDGPKDAMVIAFGAGITAGSVLASEEVRSLDVVDLNPDIEGINDLFTEVNGDVYHRDRFRFHNDDGRNFLVTSPKRYDLIIGDSTHPRAYDSWILYTEEFYRAAKNRLAEDGVFAQWVPVLNSMRGELFNIHLNTFRTVFPNTTVWYIYGSDQAFLLATPEPLAIDAARLQSKLDRLPAWFRAEEYQIDTVAHVGGFFWMDGGALDAMLRGESRVNTDDVHYFDKQSAVAPLPPQLQMPQFQASILPYLRGADRGLMEAVGLEQRTAGYLADFAYYGMEPALYRAWCLNPDNGDARYWIDRHFSGQVPDHADFCSGVKVGEFQDMLALDPGNPMTLNGLADALGAAGRYEEALVVARRAIERDPGNAMFQDTYGWILHNLGRPAEAVPALRAALEGYPDHPLVLYHLGAALYAAGDAAEGRRYLAEALRRDPDFEGAVAARGLLD